MKPPKTILLVDRDAALADALAEQFRLSDECRFETADTPERAEIRLRSGGIDLVLAEAGLIPDFSTATRTLPIAKPLRLANLLASIREALRDHDLPVETGLPVGPHRFLPDAKLLIGLDDRRVRLTEKESAILSHLCRTPGEFVPRARLLAEVWGYGPGITTHTLETHIYRLRRKIGVGAQGERWLMSEPGGYRLLP